MNGDIFNKKYFRAKNLIRKFTPSNIITFLYLNKMRYINEKNGLLIENDSVNYHIKRNNDEIRISTQHAIYLNDIIECFDIYFSAVKPIKCGKTNIVDFSTPRWHWTNGFDLFPILFTSFVEPVVTTNQYLEFAQLEKDAVVLDLGAYSGLTSILFDMAIPSGGRVIALEADSQNIIACKENFALYEKLKKRNIELLPAAIWKDDLGIQFSSEGNMGSSVIDIVGSQRGGDIIIMPSYSLQSIAERFQLKRVDFIKCDIEGAESVIFDQPEFFLKFRPKIIIECHNISSGMTTQPCIEVLSKYGYDCVQTIQRGFPLPLLMCVPLEKNNSEILGRNSDV